MKTYRTCILLLADVVAADERHACERSRSVLDRLQEHLQLALRETRAVLVNPHLSARFTEARGRRQARIDLELHLEVNSALRAAEELRKALPLLNTYVRLAFEGTVFHPRDIEAAEIFLKRY